MLTSLRRLVAGWIRPVVGQRGWLTLRKLDVRGERRRTRRVLEARISERVRADLLRDQRRAVDNTLSSRSRRADLTASQRQVLEELDPFLARRPNAALAIIGGADAGALTGLITQCFPSVQVTVVSSTLGVSARHVRLAAAGPFHAILATGEREAPAELLTNVLFHLRRGGMLAIADLDPEQPAHQDLLQLVLRLTTLRAHRGLPTGAAADNDERSLVRAIRRVVIGDRYVVLENRTASLAKMRDHEMADLLAVVEPAMGEVLVRREPQTFTPRSVVRDHREDSTTRITPDLAVPGLELREYQGVVCAPGQVAVKDNIILAESYRHLLRPRLRSKRFADVAPLFASVRRDISEPATADGVYFYWDSEFPGHFGHVLTEQVSKLWALETAHRRHPDIRVLLGHRWGQPMTPFERAILEAVGVTEDKVLLFHRPTRVERLLAASPMVSMPEYVSPDIAETWDAVGDAIVKAAGSAGPRPRRIFCSRRSTKRLCRNTAEVEALFRASGFDIVFPEEMSVADQILLFRGAERVAGFAGSALFTLMFSARPTQVTMITPESYTATNEYLIGAVRGHAFDVFWSQPDDSSFRSSFAVDMDREGKLLRDHLARED